MSIIEAMNIGRLGVYTKFPNLEKYINSLDSKNVICELNSLKRYSKGEFFEIEEEYVGKYTYSIANAKSDLNYLCGHFENEYLVNALKNNSNWQEGYRKAVYYRYWFERINRKFCDKILDEFNSGQREQLLLFSSMAVEISYLGIFIKEGLIEKAKKLIEEYFSYQSLELIENPIPIFYDSKNIYNRRTQYFILRLFNSYISKTDENFPSCAYDEPLFNAIIRYWDTTNIKLIEHLLLCLCDRHTHQCRPDTATKFYDFSWPGFEYLPIEVLMVLRLRSERGLENPILDHIIMNTPLGELYPKKEPYMDDFLLGILKRVRQEYPDFADDLFGAGAPYEFEIKTKETNKWKFWKK
ncbi:MAG: hypothetical protein LKF82_02375 [Acinetobacter populi]|jgi:hypothetical protein|uniref:hypothetical protein n=1 Tax=Acinetobacter populi TaxID=1582270 RepID=UPI0023541766|nr:hypothetical protein [Acinetobacter populi]MCH4246678.1 hypothetical protein [Acinetobacter populi]